MAYTTRNHAIMLLQRRDVNEWNSKRRQRTIIRNNNEWDRRNHIMISNNRRKVIPLQLSSKDESGVIDDESDGGKNMIGQYGGVIVPLLLVYVSNQWSRYSISYLVNFNGSEDGFTAMNVDLGLSEAQYGTLASLAFTALFALASLAAGSLVDQYPQQKKQWTVASAMGWSTLTAITALLVHSYQEILATRILMGLTCALTTPLAYTLLRDTIPPQRLALANSLYGSGVYLGGALASLSILLDNQLGWRNTLLVIAAYGVFAALLSSLLLPTPAATATIVDDKKQQQVITLINEDAPSSFLGDAATVLESSQVRWIFASSFLRFCSGLCIGVWAAPYFRSTFPQDVSQYAVINAVIVSVCGVTSGIVGGILSDKISSNNNNSNNSNNNNNSRRLLVPALGSALAVPAFYQTVHATQFETAMVWLAVEYLVAECWFGPTIAVLLQSTPKQVGGTAQGMFTLTGALGNLAPSLLGVLYAQSSSSSSSTTIIPQLSDYLTYFVCTGYILSAIGFFISSLSPPSENITQSKNSNT